MTTYHMLYYHVLVWIPFTNFPSLSSRDPPVPSIEAVLEKIKDAVYKRGVRTTEFFRDFDKLRCGNVTEKQVLQYMCALFLECQH